MIQSDNSDISYGVIGPIPCPEQKEDMKRKKKEYLQLINENEQRPKDAAPVTAVEWISKKRES